MQLVTLNIGGARKLRPGPYDYTALAADLAAALRDAIDIHAPAIIALQETGRAQRDGVTHAVGAALAAALGDTYISAFAAEVTMQHQPHSRLWSRETYNGLDHAAEGNGIVTNLTPAAWPWATINTTWMIPTTISAATLYSTGNRDTQPRNLMVASLNYKETPLYLLNTHLGVVTGEDRYQPAHPRTQTGTRRRLDQITQIMRVVDELRTAESHHAQAPRPLILTGDFNAIPKSTELDQLRERLGWLQPENPPDERWSHSKHRILIDHVLVDDPMRRLPIKRCYVHTTLPELSDHRPVIAIFEET